MSNRDIYGKIPILWSSSTPDRPLLFLQHCLTFFFLQENGILIVLSIPPLNSGQNQIGGYQNIRISIILKSSSSGTFHLSIYILTKNIAMHIFAMSWIEKMDHDSNDSDGILRGSSRISPFL